MSKALQENLKFRRSKSNKRLKTEDSQESALADLMERIDFRDEDPTIINLTTEGGLVKSLEECKIECLLKEKVSEYITFPFYI